MLYMISYDLMTPGQDYKKVDSYIQALGGREVLRSQWLVVSDRTANTIWTEIKQRVDNNDRLLVTELTRNAEWTASGLLITDADAQTFFSRARL